LEDGDVPDDVYEKVAQHFTETELIDLTLAAFKDLLFFSVL
jgi:hypothetical protein